VVFIASCPQGSSGVVRFLIGGVLAEACVKVAQSEFGQGMEEGVLRSSRSL
jgi:hypothetical protein